MPVRIQRRRTKGWRMPSNTVFVGRPGIWGNPYIAEHPNEAAEAVRLYREWILTLIRRGYNHDLNFLRGKNIACWCPVGAPCHGDVLLELANTEPALLTKEAPGEKEI